MDEQVLSSCWTEPLVGGAGSDCFYGDWMRFGLTNGSNVFYKHPFRNAKTPLSLPRPKSTEMKQERLSPQYTTCFKDIIIVNT